MRHTVAGQYEPYAAGVAPDDDATAPCAAAVATACAASELPDAVADRVAGRAGVEAVDPVREGGAMMRSGSGELYTQVTTAPETGDHDVVSGTEPAGPSEVMLAEDT